MKLRQDRDQENYKLIEQSENTSVQKSEQLSFLKDMEVKKSTESI